MKRFTQISTSNFTTISRNGNGIFCSTGINNIADEGSGFKDIVDW
jgi:hypothetical protein